MIEPNYANDSLATAIIIVLAHLLAAFFMGAVKRLVLRHYHPRTRLISLVEFITDYISFTCSVLAALTGAYALKDRGLPTSDGALILGIAWFVTQVLIASVIEQATTLRRYT